MKVEAVKTRPLLPPQDDLFAVIKERVKTIPERSVVVVTSKVVAIHQGRCIKIERGVDREKLAKQEADWYVDRDIVPGEHVMFTIKDSILIASAGIDKSNGNGYFILWPKKPFEMAEKIRQFLKKIYRVKQCGVIITDSHLVMMRRGLTGFALAYAGFEPLRNYIGKPDIFGQNMVVSLTNVADGLAAAAVVIMGEGKEQTPLAVISDIAGIRFSEVSTVYRGRKALLVPQRDDLFRPFLEVVPWKKGGGGRRR